MITSYDIKMVVAKEPLSLAQLKEEHYKMLFYAQEFRILANVLKTKINEQLPIEQQLKDK